MDCRTAQSFVNSYINHKLSMEEQDQFLKHVESCPSCYEELETYFIVYYAVKQLDNDKDGTFDMSRLLREDIRRRHRMIRRYRWRETILLVLIVLAASGVIYELLKTLGIFLM